TRIVGGQETGVNEYPWMCGIVDRTGIFCGASIIHAQYVLTAAHCLYKVNINEILLIVGEHDVTTGNDTKASRIYKIQECKIHPEYNFIENGYNDIAVCKIVGKIEYSAAVGPVCLPFKYKDYSFIGNIVTALGWGSTEFGGEPSDVLQEVDLEVVNNKYPNSNDNNILYTFSPGKDTCQMDSGGPLLWDNHTNHMKLVGIVSSGVGCASNESSLNMRVGAFLNWIVSVTPGKSWRKKRRIRSMKTLSL
ncbi:Serine proteinase stubble, partial [Acromyrmex echinatior]